MNPLDYDLTYPKKPTSLCQYIRKFRMDKGLLIKDFAKKLGVTEDTVVNWERRGSGSTKKHFKRVSHLIDEINGVDLHI